MNSIDQISLKKYTENVQKRNNYGISNKKILAIAIHTDRKSSSADGWLPLVLRTICYSKHTTRVLRFTKNSLSCPQ